MCGLKLACSPVCAIPYLAQAFETSTLFQSKRDKSGLGEDAGWGGRIRTYGTRYQKALPYHLATPHQRRRDTQIPTGEQPSKGINFLFLVGIIAQQVFADANLALSVDHAVKCAFGLGADRAIFTSSCSDEGARCSGVTVFG